MSRYWLRRAALCVCFTFVAQAVHAQGLITPAPRVSHAPSAASKVTRPIAPAPLTAAVLAAAEKAAQDPGQQILQMADESMNGWLLSGTVLLGVGASLIYIASETSEDADPEETDQLMNWGLGLVIGGTVLAGVGLADKGTIWITKTRGGIAAGKTINLGKKPRK